MEIKVLIFFVLFFLFVHATWEFSQTRIKPAPVLGVQESNHWTAVGNYEFDNFNVLCLKNILIEMI